MTKKAFVIIHFGNNPLFLEYELYFLCMLKDFTKNDIVYMYSSTDTPQIYVDIIHSLDIITIPYNDNKITYNVEFNSHYTHFNLLRICNFIFALTLIQYEKICIVESDMIITQNIDEIFDFKCPAILYYPLDKFGDKINQNVMVEISQRYILEKCPDESFSNGGIMLFEPSMTIFRKLKNNLKIIIKSNCIYPNETLFLYTFKKFYNIPVTYNMSHFFVNKYKFSPIKILHFNNSAYKPIYIIKDNYVDKITNRIKRRIIQNYKKKYYDKYSKTINKLIHEL